MKPSCLKTPWGLELYSFRTDAYKTHTLSMCLTFEPDPVRSPMRSLLCAVLHRGTRSYPTQDALNRYLDGLFDAELPVRNQRRAGKQVLSLGLGVLDARFLPEREDLLSDGLRIVEEIWRKPFLDGDGLLREDFVEGERKILIDEIRGETDAPRSLAARCCRDLMFPRSAASIRLVGSEEQVASIDRAALTDLWRNEVRMSHPVFFYVGSEPAGAVAERLRATFGDLTPFQGNQPNKPTLPREAFLCPNVRTGERELSISQSILALGLSTPVMLDSPDYHAFMVFNELFSQSPISRLFTRVREEKGLCYDIDARYDPYTGGLTVVSGLRPDRVEEAEEAILAQVAELAAGRFTRSELAAAKRSLDSAYRHAFDDPDAPEIYWFGRLLYGVDEDVEECRRKIAAVTPSDVIRVAGTVALRARFTVRGKREEAGK